MIIWYEGYIFGHSSDHKLSFFSEEDDIKMIWFAAETEMCLQLSANVGIKPSTRCLSIMKY